MDTAGSAGRAIDGGCGGRADPALVHDVHMDSGSQVQSHNGCTLIGGACAAEGGIQNKVYWKFINQPKEYIRLRYSTELKKGKSCNLDGQDSTREHPTCPSVKIFGYSGRASILACLVTAAKPYRCHPNKLVGPDCLAGMFTRSVQCVESGTLVELNNLGIERTKVQEAAQELAKRRDCWRDWADPFRKGYDHITPNELKAIDMKAVRICIQLYRQCDLTVTIIKTEEGTITKRYQRVYHEPVVSTIIRNSHLHYDLKILRVFYSSPPFNCVTALGNGDVLLLCEKVNDVIRVAITETEEWTKASMLVDFEAKEVHGQVAIIFKMPLDKIPQHLDHVFVRLFRQVDGSISNPVRLPEVGQIIRMQWPAPPIQERQLNLTYSPGPSTRETHHPNIVYPDIPVLQAGASPQLLPDLNPSSKEILDQALNLQEQTNCVSASMEMLSMTADDKDDCDAIIDVESF